MRCFECGHEMTLESKRRYKYVESGLDNVWLVDWKVYTCARCRVEYPKVPLPQINAAIAQALVRKPESLTGRDARFLRKEMGWRQSDLAELLGVVPETLSRWENEKRALDPSADRLLRSLYNIHEVQAGRAVDPAHFFDEFLKQLRRVKSKPKAKPLSLDIPPQALVAEYVRMHTGPPYARREGSRKTNRH